VPGVPEVLLNRLEQAPATFRISGIRTALPGISDGTIRNALDDLRRDGLIEAFADLERQLARTDTRTKGI
jgi:DNA-binding HxlR family transcriptional regulator